MAFQPTQMPQSSLTAAEFEVITVNSDSEGDDTDSNATTVVGELDDSVPLTDPLEIDSNSSNENVAVAQVDQEDLEFDMWQQAADNKKQQEAPGKLMICRRCRNETIGTFTNREAFLFHIQRHWRTSWNYNCFTCEKPFSKLSYCISHEIRVHQLETNYTSKDGVIAYAKNYVKEKAAAREARAGTSSTVESDGNETDPEDPKFYNNSVVRSTALYPYRGPPVEQLEKPYRKLRSQSTKKAKRSQSFDAYNSENESSDDVGDDYVLETVLEIELRGGYE